MNRIQPKQAIRLGDEKTFYNDLFEGYFLPPRHFYGATKNYLNKTKAGIVFRVDTLTINRFLVENRSYLNLFTRKPPLPLLIYLAEFRTSQPVRCDYTVTTGDRASTDDSVFIVIRLVAARGTLRYSYCKEREWWIQYQ